MKDKNKHRIIGKVMPNINVKVTAERTPEKWLRTALPWHQSLIKTIQCDKCNTKCTWDCSKESPSKKKGPGKWFFSPNEKKKVMFLQRRKQWWIKRIHDCKTMM